MCQCDYKIDFNSSSIKLYIWPALRVNSVANITFNIDVHSNLGVPDPSQLVILSSIMVTFLLFLTTVIVACYISLSM